MSARRHVRLRHKGETSSWRLQAEDSLSSCGGDSATLSRQESQRSIIIIMRDSGPLNLNFGHVLVRLDHPLEHLSPRFLSTLVVSLLAFSSPGITHGSSRRLRNKDVDRDGHESCLLPSAQSAFVHRLRAAELHYGEIEENFRPLLSAHLLVRTPRGRACWSGQGAQTEGLPPTLGHSANQPPPPQLDERPMMKRGREP